MTTRLRGTGARLLEWVSTCLVVLPSRRNALFSGASLATQLRKAVDMARDHKECHAQLSSTFPSHAIRNWEAMVAAWNKDPKSANPYVEPVISMLAYR
jgi:hypothetical protein